MKLEPTYLVVTHFVYAKAAPSAAGSITRRCISGSCP